MTQWFELLGGLGIFLLGVVIMTEGLKGLAGDALRGALTRFTRSPYSGAATGAASTAILQSSSATTVAAVGFVGAGLLSFPQALGVIFGANIGTTITGWLVALLGFKLQLDTLVLPGILFGVLLHLFGPGRSRAGGMGLAGFGLIFVGINAMQSGMAGMEGQFSPDSFPPDTLTGRAQLLLVGVVITLVTQSSSAGVAAALTALNTGTIGFEQAAALVIGMDVGTTVTALVATLGGSAETRRTGYSHVVYNLFTGLGAFFLLTPYVMLWQWLAPAALLQQSEIALVAFHTGFNIVGVMLVLPFTAQFSRLMYRLVPERAGVLGGRLDRQLLKDPMVALESLRVTLHDISTAQFQFTLGLLRAEPIANPERLEELSNAIKLCAAYLDDIHSSPKRQREWQFLMTCMHSVDHLRRLNTRLHQDKLASLWQSNERLIKLGTELDGGLRDLRKLRQQARSWADVAGRASAMARSCLDQAQLARERVMADIAEGKEDVPHGNELIESARWMQRVADHCWRISHYLGEADLYSHIAEGGPVV